MSEKEPPKGDIVLHVGGFVLTATDRDDEPRIRDEEVARGLGYGRPNEFRRLLVRLKKDGELPGVHVRAELARTSMPRGGERSIEVDFFHLTRVEVAMATMHARTDRAKMFRRQMAEVFVEATRQLRAAPRAAEVDVHLLQGPRVGDTIEGRQRVKDVVDTVRVRTGATTARIHGLIRRHAHVPSAYGVSLVVWPTIRAILYDFAEGRLLPGSPGAKPARLPSNVRQLPLPGMRQSH